MDLSLILDMAADAAGERAALGQRDAPVSYGELRRRAEAAAEFLRRRPGERIAYLGLNGPHLPIALFAAGLARRPFVPLNYRLPDADLQRLVARTAPATVIADPDMIARINGVAGIELIGTDRFAAALDDPEFAGFARGEDEADIAVLLYTSGTTGEPKAAVLRHHHLASYVLSSLDLLSAEPEEAALVSVPPYHVAGIAAILTGVYCGRRIVHLPAFHPEHWVAAAAKERISHAMLVPTMLGRILDVVERGGLSLPHLRAISYGGGRMPLAVIERAMRLLPKVDFTNAYGLTETSSTVAVLDPEDHRRAFSSTEPRIRARLGSVGRPLPGVEIEIRAGEIFVRGGQISGEYLGRKAIADDGWFPTRDAGYFDDEGYLFIEGRLDDVIVRGGENISPGEIEDALRGHPAVADVAVIGVPDDEWGERIAAAIVLKGETSETALRDFLRGRLRSTKIPEEIRFCPGLPYNDTGKLLRRVLKHEFSGLRA